MAVCGDDDDSPGGDDNNGDDNDDGGMVPEECVDDDLFCNGIARMVDGECVMFWANPCDDGQDCTADACDEATDSCTHTAEAECATCEGACVPACDGRECGDDSCGGSCGDCAEGQGCAATDGQCVPADQLGSCAQPRELEVLLGPENEQILTGDSSDGLHQAVPSCNSTSTSVEDVYKFTITEPTGIDVRSTGDGDFEYDTVLHIRKEDPETEDNECLNDDPAVTVGCSDDSSPPGNFGSRVATLLEPGDYYLIVDGFDASQVGPYALQIMFLADGCVRQCDGKFCGGDDGCGGTCGGCDEGFACTEEPPLQCLPDPCVPDCVNDDGSKRTCGDDGCRGSCGECAADELCVAETGECDQFQECDHMAPTCDPGCDDGYYCAADCTCREIGEDTPDLVINADRLESEIVFETIFVDDASCAVAEECVTGNGERSVMRFSVEVVNQGQGTLDVPNPPERPDLFEFSPCHGHFHFKGFALYELVNADGKTVATGRKQAFCMEDTEQFHEGPGVSCQGEFSCDEQGISAGWSDLYGNALDCQWLDITGDGDNTPIPSGTYTLRVSVNPDRSFEEMSFDNNTVEVEVEIP